MTRCLVDHLSMPIRKSHPTHNWRCSQSELKSIHHAFTMCYHYVHFMSSIAFCAVSCRSQHSSHFRSLLLFLECCRALHSPVRHVLIGWRHVATSREHTRTLPLASVAIFLFAHQIEYYFMHYILFISYELFSIDWTTFAFCAPLMQTDICSAPNVWNADMHIIFFEWSSLHICSYYPFRSAQKNAYSIKYECEVVKTIEQPFRKFERSCFVRDRGRL